MLQKFQSVFILLISQPKQKSRKKTLWKFCFNRFLDQHCSSFFLYKKQLKTDKLHSKMCEDKQSNFLSSEFGKYICLMQEESLQ